MKVRNTDFLPVGVKPVSMDIYRHSPVEDFPDGQISVLEGNTPHVEPPGPEHAAKNKEPESNKDLSAILYTRMFLHIFLSNIHFNNT